MIFEILKSYLILFFTVFFIIFLVMLFIQVRKRKSRNLTVHHISWYHRLYTSFLFNRAFRSIFRLLVLFIFMQFIGITLPTVLAEEIAEHLEEKKEESKSWWKGIAIAAALTLGAWLLMKLLRAGGFYPGSGNSGSDTSFSSGSDTSSDSGSDAASDSGSEISGQSSGSEISGQSSGSEISSKSSGSEPAQNLRFTRTPQVVNVTPETKYDYAALDIIKYNEKTYNHMIEIRRDQESILNILQNRGIPLDSVRDIREVTISLDAYVRLLTANNVLIYKDLAINFYCATNMWLNEVQNGYQQDPSSARETLAFLMDKITPHDFRLS